MTDAQLHPDRANVRALSVPREVAILTHGGDVRAPSSGAPSSRGIHTVRIIRIGQLRRSDCATVWDCSGGAAVNRHPVRRIAAEDAAPSDFMSPTAVSPSKWLHFALFFQLMISAADQSQPRLLPTTWRMRGHAAPRHPIRISESPRGAEPSDRIPQLDPVTRRPPTRGHPETAL